MLSPRSDTLVNASSVTSVRRAHGRELFICLLATACWPIKDVHLDSYVVVQCSLRVMLSNPSLAVWLAAALGSVALWCQCCMHAVVQYWQPRAQLAVDSAASTKLVCCVCAALNASWSYSCSTYSYRIHPSVVTADHGPCRFPASASLASLNSRKQNKVEYSICMGVLLK